MLLERLTNAAEDRRKKMTWQRCTKYLLFWLNKLHPHERAPAEPSDFENDVGKHSTQFTLKNAQVKNNKRRYDETLHNSLQKGLLDISGFQN